MRQRSHDDDEVHRGRGAINDRRVMYRDMRLLFCALLTLLLTTHRLPAPISEVPQATPPPKPKQEAAPKIKSKPEATPKPKATPNRSFAGSWAGNVISKSSDGSSASYTYGIRISDDEKTVLINMAEVGKSMSGPPTPASCTRFREALTWSLSSAGASTTYSMRVNSDGSASFVREGSWTNEDNESLTYTHTGTLSRQDVSSAPSLQQPAASIATAAPPTKSVGGLPVAKPVPEKPGFVYNPFDSNTKVLLDVRSKASGSKVKDPFSGKLFIVP